MKALTHLAEAYDGGLVKIHRIADLESIPEKFLEGILVTLKNARLVASERGREGGYRLRRPPFAIMVGGGAAGMGRSPGPSRGRHGAGAARAQGASPSRPLRRVPGRPQRRLRDPRPHDPRRRA